MEPVPLRGITYMEMSAEKVAGTQEREGAPRGKGTLADDEPFTHGMLDEVIMGHSLACSLKS